MTKKFLDLHFVCAAGAVLWCAVSFAGFGFEPPKEVSLYFLKNASSGKDLIVQSNRISAEFEGSGFGQLERSPSTLGMFYVESQTGQVQVRNVFNNLCLTAASSEDGAPVVSGACENSNGRGLNEASLFRLGEGANGSRVLVSMYGKCVTLLKQPIVASEDGAPVETQIGTDSCERAEALAEWYLEPVHAR